MPSPRRVSPPRNRFRLFASVAAFVGAASVLTACVPAAAPVATPVSTPVTTTTLPPLPGAPTGGTVAPVDITYPSGAVTPGDFPDPHVVAFGGVYYAYSTGSGFTTVQVMSSPNLVDWTMGNDAMPPLSATPDGNSWAVTNFNTWAPAVTQLADGTFVMYYAALDRASGKHCIGRATSTAPEGPFVDTSTTAFVCAPDHGGSIDPEPVSDSNGTQYLLWKSEGISGSEPTHLWIVKLGVAGKLAEAPTAHQLLTTASGSWEEPITESPSMMPDPSGTGYLLFYSGSNWDSSGYAVGVARCTSITGPCSRIYSTPVLANRGSVVGPGGEHLFKGLDGHWQVAFASWTDTPHYQFFFGVPVVPHVRSLHFLPVSFPDGKNPGIG
jgi:beta-xylosidase